MANVKSLPKRFWWLFFCECVWRLIAWFVIPFAMLGLKKANMDAIKDKIQYGEGLDIQRYIFPKWLECVDTTDDYFPAGMYEPSLIKMQKYLGSMITGWWNLSVRNVGMGLSWQLAIPVSGYWYKLSDEEKQEKGLFDNHYPFWKFTFKIGKKVFNFRGLVFKVGYVSYRNWKGLNGGTPFLAVPRITLRVGEENV